MGPHSYDVVSLVRDSYLSITPKTREFFISHYKSCLHQRMEFLKVSNINSVFNGFNRELLMMGLQRNIKALGSFGYLCSEKSKPSYLTYVQQTLQTLLHRNHISSENVNLFELFPTTMDFLAELFEERLSFVLKEKTQDALSI
jgi:N-acetylmuramate 1-kinase